MQDKDIVSLPISEASKRNWSRLSTDVTGKLTSRANKMNSKKRILPQEYFAYSDNLTAVENILNAAEQNSVPVRDVIFTAAKKLAEQADIEDKGTVLRTLDEFDGTFSEIIYSLELPSDEYDILGLLYQCLITEGEKNLKGSYFTPVNIVGLMTGDISVRNGEGFLDPCCGSGAYLLNVNALPEELFGVDNDPVAVFIAKINLMIKFRYMDFEPNIFCADFLTDELFNRDFKYIVTNPPWGAQKSGEKDSFGEFFKKSYSLLREGGTIDFLLPESVLSVNTHKGFRSFVLENGGPDLIRAHGSAFSGVTTGYVDIAMTKGNKNDCAFIEDAGASRYVEKSVFFKNAGLEFKALLEEDRKILEKVFSKAKNSLKGSVFALGIVTGDNKNKLFNEPIEGTEPIYTGKEISPYRLAEAKNHVVYDRASFQQAAKDEYYRAEEKLVYRFICDRPVFAYDDEQKLFLNSANILIPKVEGMSVKTVMAFLNSELYNYIYRTMFSGLKVLKSSLLRLPFMRISAETDAVLTYLVKRAMSGDDFAVCDINNVIYDLFLLTDGEISRIKESL
ncbi:MAG: N-6 DNA methylase [Christensenellaceae bacterium]|nr:N-6 DNA methylase [Christensenellaceae bacterium]